MRMAINRPDSVQKCNIKNVQKWLRIRHDESELRITEILPENHQKLSLV